jgi:F-type H+-transporting ATPase subunit gamma
MAKAREIKRRIRSIDNTRQITKTMEMVAASKLKRAQDRVVAARPFDEFMRQVIAHVQEGATEELADFPLLRRSEASGRVGVLVVTSNRGLAGAFNANLVKAARAHMKELRADGKEIELHVIGKKGASMLRYLGDTPERTIVDLPDRPSYEDAGTVAEPLIEGFLEERLDAVYLVYSQFRSPVEQRPVVAQLLPLPERGELETGLVATEARPARDEESERRYEPIYEFLPSPAAILGQLLPLFLRYGVYRAASESAASEHGARRTAMKNATDNAKELIRNLTRSYNRARQAQITQEIAELVGGSEALRG